MTKADKEGQRKTPILRFKGFTDDWEQRKLNEATTRILRKNKNLISKRPLTISAQYGLIDQQAFFNKQVASSNLENYLLLEKGEFAYNKSYSDGFPYGTIKKLNLYDNGAVSTLYIAFKANADINSDFLENLFSSNKWNNEVYKIAAEGARNHGLLNISPDDFFNIKITISKDSQEQAFISKFLRVFDNLLALYERKTRLLGKVRTFLTQRLFSNSSKVSLYFDNKNWSEHKISEFLTERNEKVVPNSSIPLVSFTVEKGVTPKSKRYNREFLVKDDNKKYKITKKDDIVYNPANLKFGAIARNKFGNAAFSPIYVTFITKLNPAFTEFLVRRKNFINLALKYQEGTVYERMAVKSKDFLNLKIYLPNSSRDINHIAQILQSLDTLVSLNKNKVSLITLIKKELLNTMFI